MSQIPLATAPVSGGVTQDTVNTLINEINGALSTVQSTVVQNELLLFSPLQNGSCQMYITPANYASLTLSGAGVTSITDQTGNITVGQPGGTKPQWGLTSFNNSAPGIAIGPATTDLVATDAAAIQNIFATGGTIAGTFVITGNGANQQLFLKSNAIATGGYTVLFYGSGNALTFRFQAGASTTAGVWDIASAVTLNVPYVFTLSYNSSTPTVAPVLYLNGIKQTFSVAQALVGTVGTDAGANLIIGNKADGDSQPLLGILGSLVLYNAVQNAVFLTKLQSYLGALSGMPTANLYLVCGQSEVVGNATAQPTAIYSLYPANPPAQNALIWNGNTFEPLVLGKNNAALNANSFGPEISFGITQSARMGQPAYILKYAVGATSLAVDWAPTAGAQWVGMRAAIDAALPYLAAQGIIPVIGAFGWDQGQTDGQNLTYANAYQANEIAFAAALLSTAFAAYTLSPDYTFCISQIGALSAATIPYAATIRAAQIIVGARPGNVSFATTDLPLNADQVHFSAPGEITLGQRFSNSIPTNFPIYSATWLKAQPNTGRFVSQSLASGSAVSLTTATSANVTSLSVPAGDWDIVGVVDFVLGAATATKFKGGSNTTSATLGGQDTAANLPLITTALSDTYSMVTPPVKYSFIAPTTVYLVAQATFSAGTVTAYGTIRAREWR